MPSKWVHIVVALPYKYTDCFMYKRFIFNHEVIVCVEVDSRVGWEMGEKKVRM